MRGVDSHLFDDATELRKPCFPSFIFRRDFMDTSDHQKQQKKKKKKKKERTSPIGKNYLRKYIPEK